MFNALTNATDPDGDVVSLYAVTSPSLGSVSNDASGNIYYTRNPNLFGQDSFTYIVTDGNGGYGVGNVTILQQDTSGDGLSDQWDLRYGFDPNVDNSMADPDNDGLPNLAEFVLGTNPNVPDNPLNLSAVTNGMQFSGFVQIPILGLSPVLAQTPPITFYVNGEPAENSFVSQGPDGQWQINWDTTYLTNGSYQVQLDCQVAPSSSPDSITNVFGVQKTVQVSNPITFDKLTTTFGNQLFIEGMLADTNQTYDVYLYDESGDLLVYATNVFAPNGQIGLAWDLTDGQGHQISFGNILAEFYLHPQNDPNGIQPLDDPSTPPFPHWFLKEGVGSGQNVFSAAWGWDGALSYFPPFTSYRTELMQDGVINILGNPADPNSYLLLPTANIPYADSAFRYDSESDKNLLKQALSLSGNFFWFGHCDDNAIFGNKNHSGIGAGDVETWLSNFAFTSSPKHPRTNQHPYHLVILNACESYNSSWANVFGIDFSATGSSDSVADYENAGRQPRALVGWTKIIYVPSTGDYSGLAHAEYAEALGYLFGYWMDGYPLYYCVGQFAGDAIPNGFTGVDSWEISGCVDLERGE